MKCCICGKEIDKYGNNPDGALGQIGQQIIWGEYDRCCDDCNQEYVIPGRIGLLIHKTDMVSKVPNK